MAGRVLALRRGAIGLSAGLGDFASCSSALATAERQTRSYQSGSDGGYSFLPRSTPLQNTVLRIVPQQTAFVVERFGKYSRTLTPGLHVLIPVVSQCPP